MAGIDHAVIGARLVMPAVTGAPPSRRAGPGSGHSFPTAAVPGRWTAFAAMALPWTALLVFLRREIRRAETAPASTT